MRRMPPPDDAEPVTDVDGTVIGYIKLNVPAKGGPLLTGWNVYKASGPNGCIPYKNVPSRDDAITTLKHARYRPRPDPSIDWRPGDR
jgi:hypothetical protein